MTADTRFGGAGAKRRRCGRRLPASRSPLRSWPADHRHRAYHPGCGTPLNAVVKTACGFQAETPPHVQRGISPVDRDAAASVQLEQARLTCERPGSATSVSAEYETLRYLHRELGLAGLAASSNIPTSARGRLLSEAHRACAGQPSNTDELEPLLESLRQAENALEGSLVAPGLSHHMHLAHMHLLRGRDLLRAHFLDPRPNGREAATRSSH